MATTVFISYAQVPEEHKRQVAQLVTTLRAAGLLVCFDGDVKTPQGPPEGWPKWMLNSLEEADWVLVVCNEAYYRRFRGKELSGKGLGSRWEGAIIGQELYSEGTLNRKFIPVLFGDEPLENVPEPLRGATYYRCPDDLPKLAAALTGDSTADTESGSAAPSPSPPEPKKRVARKPPSRESSNAEAVSTKGRRGTDRAPILAHAVLSLGSFGCALVLIGVLLWKADVLVRLGLIGNFYYVVLLPLGLAVAAFLFGALRSFGHYRGKQFGGVLTLGGPVVGFLLVVILGFVLPPSAGNFPLTIYVGSDSPNHEAILKGFGQVLLDIGGDRRPASIGDKGQAFFSEIPANFRGREVNLLVDAEGYELANPGQKFRLGDNSLYLAVRKKAGRVNGRVQAEEDRKPLAGARITVAGVSTTTDAAGHFEIVIPADRLQQEHSLEAIATGYAPAHVTVVPNSNEAVVNLKRQP